MILDDLVLLLIVEEGSWELAEDLVAKKEGSENPTFQCYNHVA